MPISKEKGHINLPNTDAVSWWWPERLFRGFNVITSHQKDVILMLFFFFFFPSILFSSISLYPQLPLSFPLSLMKRLMFDQSPPHGRPESIVDKRPQLLFKRGLASVVQKGSQKEKGKMWLSFCRSEAEEDPRGPTCPQYFFGGKRTDNVGEEAGTKKKCRTSTETHNLRGDGMKGKGKRRAGGERHEKVGAACSGLSPTWADEMGDGWGGVRDKSQRGLRPWETLLLWSVKNAALSVVHLTSSLAASQATAALARSVSWRVRWRRAVVRKNRSHITTRNCSCAVQNTNAHRQTFVWSIKTWRNLI